MADIERQSQFYQEKNKPGNILRTNPSSQGVAGIQGVTGNEETQIKEQVTWSCLFA